MTYRPASLALLILLSLLVSSFAFSQDRSCQSDAHHRKLLAEDPAYAEKYFAQFNEILQRENSVQRSNGLDSVFVIPVVVHVLYNNSDQNISDEQIKSQIDVMNEDFAAINVTRLDVPQPLRSLVQDSRIRFTLAHRNLNGGLFNGIIRVETSIEKFNLFDPRIYADSLGGSTAWPRDQYMNIWCTSLENNALGYANFPSGPAEQDGVVINTRAFGRMGKVKSPYNLGRTCTHETGHWLNLYHIWGDDGGSCTSNPLAGDQIPDTPDQSDSHFRCPGFPATDSCTPSGNGTYYMNYLDYTDDQCMMFFTAGQINRMRNAAVVSRLPLLTSTAKDYPVIQGFEVEIDSVLTPVFEPSSRCFKPVVRVTNRGSISFAYLTFRYRVDNGIMKIYSDPDSKVQPGESVLITLDEISGEPGNRILEVWLEADDQVKTNNFISASFRANAASTTDCGNSQPLVYPNPVGYEHKACIKTNYPESRLITLVVYDVAGREIQRQEQVVNPGDAIPVNLLTSQAGIYIAKLFSDEGSNVVKFVFNSSRIEGGVQLICK